VNVYEKTALFGGFLFKFFQLYILYTHTEDYIFLTV